jgi:hypothetical protein
MTALSATVRVTRKIEEHVRAAHPVKTATAIYGGAALCLEAANGFARPVAAGLTNPEFLGFSTEDIASSGAASGTLSVNVIAQGIIELPLAGVTGATAVTDIGTTTYMADDGTGFTTASTGNVSIGKVAGLVAGMITIFFQADALRSL